MTTEAAVSDSHQFIQVTMSPRARSSLSMAMLRALGQPITGDKFPAERRIEDAQQRLADPSARFRPTQSTIDQTRQRLERAKQLNPMGFWELIPETMRGVKHVEPQWGGTAIKVVDHAAWPHDNGFGTDPALWSRCIVCARDPRSVVESQRDLLSDVEVEVVSEDDDGPRWERRRHAPNPGRYLVGFGGFMTWLAEQDDDLRDRVHVLDTGAMLSDPRDAMERVAAFLGLDRPDIDAAAGLIRDDLVRSEPKPWEDRHADLGQTADDLHAATLARDWAAIRAIGSEIDEHRDDQQRERRQWTDLTQGTFVLAPASMHRALTEDEALLRQMLRPSRVRRRDFTRSAWFGGWSDQTYTLRLPADLGHDVERQMVICTHPDFPDRLTVEHFQALHRREVLDA